MFSMNILLERDNPHAFATRAFLCCATLFALLLCQPNELFADEKGRVMDRGSFRINLKNTPTPGEKDGERFAKSTGYGDFKYTYRSYNGPGYHTTRAFIRMVPTNNGPNFREIIVEARFSVGCFKTEYADGTSITDKISGSKQAKGTPLPMTSMSTWYEGSRRTEPDSFEFGYGSIAQCDSDMHSIQAEYIIYENATWQKKQQAEAERARKEQEEVARREEERRKAQAEAERARREREETARQQEELADASTGDVSSYGDDSSQAYSGTSSSSDSYVSSSSESYSDTAEFDSADNGGEGNGNVGVGVGSAAGAVATGASSLAAKEKETSDDASTTHKDVATKHLNPMNAGQKIAIVGTHVFGPIVTMLPLFLKLDGLSERELLRVAKASGPRGLLGPLGYKSWHGPTFAMGGMVGFDYTNYRGLYYGPDEQPGRLVEGELSGITNHIVMRIYMLRFSLGYSHYITNLLEDSFASEDRAIFNENDIPSDGGYYTAYTPKQSILMWEVSWGIQLFQGIFSPHISHRVRIPKHLLPSYGLEIAANDSFDQDDYTVSDPNKFFDTTTTHEIVVGNSFDLTGFTLDPRREKRRSNLFLDLQTNIPITGELSPGFKVSIGYTFSVM